METNVQSAYNHWAGSYDEMENKTRDLDKIATQLMLADIIHSSSSVLEFGCGTGKNTEWLLQNAKQLTAVDFSEEMLKKARQKFSEADFIFHQADITRRWPFANHSYDLIMCNLILEHVFDLDFVFLEAARALKSNGYFFICELHPSKQYQGGKARFEMNNEIVSPDCFIHHTSDFFASAINNGLRCVELKEWFDNDERQSTPRLISFIFQKPCENI